MVREWKPPAREPARSWSGAPLDDGDVDARQRQLARQHQPCRTSSGDHYRNARSSARSNRHQRHADAGEQHTHFGNSHFRGFGLRRQFYGRSRVLKQAPCAPYV